MSWCSAGCPSALALLRLGKFRWASSDASAAAAAAVDHAQHGLLMQHLQRRSPSWQDDELAGRRRRARADGDEDEPATDGGLAWPSPFDEPAGSDDEAEDEELLRKAKEGLLLADSGEGLEGGGGSGAGGSAGGLSAGGSGSGDGGIPLDEGSQEVLGLLLARSASEPQQGSGGAGGGAGRSRFAPAGVAAALPPLFGSDPSNSRLPGLPGLGSQSRGPSFVGRQPTAVRGASSSNLGAGSRSFVFGRDDSQSALPADKVSSPVGTGKDSSCSCLMLPCYPAPLHA